MTPIRFGEPGRQRFGLFYAPQPGVPPGDGIVVCNPFGQEAIRSHRLLRVLCERLARAGCPVLRFDYRATGDSDGDDDAADWDAWIEDVAAADAEVRRRGAVDASSWFGLRLGGTLAALASERAAVRSLVLWDPVVDGAAYLSELGRAHTEALKVALVADATGRRALPRPGPAEYFGFPMPEPMRARVSALSARDFTAARSQCIVVLGDVEAAPLAPLLEVLGAPREGKPARVIAERAVGASGEAMNTAIVPVELLQAIVRSLAPPAP